MVGILIATHGKMASGMVNSVDLIMGSQENVGILELFHDTDIESFGNDIVKKVHELDQGQGVLILVDLFSASPYNQAVLNKVNMKDSKHRIVTGINLPMLIEVLGMRLGVESVEELWETAINAGKDGVKEFETEFALYSR